MRQRGSSVFEVVIILSMITLMAVLFWALVLDKKANNQDSWQPPPGFNTKRCTVIGKGESQWAQCLVNGVPNVCNSTNCTPSSLPCNAEKGIP